MITFRCQCGNGIDAPDESAGRRAKCRRCGQIVVIPMSSPPDFLAAVPPPLSPSLFSSSPPPLPAMPVPLAGRVGAEASRRGVWVALVSLAVLVMGSLGFALWRNYQSRALPARENLTVDQKHEETKEAFAATNPSPAANGGETQAISAALDRMNQALVRKDVLALGKVYDTDRLCDELDRLGAFKAVPSNQISLARSTIGGGLPAQIIASWGALIWNSHKLSKITLSDNRREAVVYDQEYQGIPPIKILQKRRWWLRVNGSTWKVWDTEDLDTGIRVSTIIASAMSSAASSGNAAAVQAEGQKFQAVGAALQKGDLAGAQTTLQSLDAMSLTPDYVAIRQFMWAAVHLRQFRYQDALKDCDSVEATGEDVPIIFEFRTIAFNKLGQYDKALQSSEKWEDALGEDGGMFYERGLALRHLNRPADAIVAFEKSLDEDHDAAGTLGELARLLPAGQKSEIGARLTHADTPAVMFKNAAPILQAARDLEGMQILIDAYRVRPESANDPLLPFYNAELDDLRKQYREAEALLKPLVPLATVKGQEHFATEYLYSAELAGDSIEAYGIAPDKSAAFLLLAGRLLLKKDDATLTQLVDLHIQGFPSDPWPYYYQARMHQAANEYDAADTAYAKAMSLDTKGTETFRLARVSARFYAGNGLSAYQDIEPRDKVFTQLCGLFALKKQAEGLANLVAARRADAPEDPNVPLWDADARFLDGDYIGAVNVLDANRATIQAVKVNGIQVNLYRFRDIYIRSQVRLKQFDAARAEAIGSQGTEKDWFHLAVVECAAGNVPDAIKAMDALLADDDYDESDLYRDPDIGPALATPAFAAWRQKHPDSTTQPAATQATH